MLRFKGRKEELGEALHLMREQNMVQWRAQAAVRRTAGLEARARAPTIPRPLHSIPHAARSRAADAYLRDPRDLPFVDNGPS